MSGNEIWDEEQWEAFLRENDRRTDRYMELMYGFMKRHPRPPLDDDAALERWKAELRSFLRDKGWQREDIILPFLWLDDAPDRDREEAWLDLGEFSGDGVLDTGGLDDVIDDFEHLPIYQRAFTLSSTVLDWAHDLSGQTKDSTLVQYCSCITQIPANVAKGHAFGYEIDALGGYIACVKRALAAANAALALLREMKAAPYMQPTRYRHLYEQTFEVRNELGVYVQELRERFHRGID